jgi:hypothetical protein
VNTGQRDRSLVQLLDTLEDHERRCRAGKARAAARHDGEGFMRWQRLLGAVRRTRGRVQAQLLGELETRGLE